MTQVSDDRSETGDDRKAEKRLRKLEKTLDRRQLDPWERYRALSDLHDAYFEVVELGDRKARFALVVMGALNALNLIVVARPGVVAELVANVGPWLGGYVAGYAVLSLYFFVQAIQTLRPRISIFPEATTTGADARAGVRFIADIVKAGAPAFSPGT